MTSKTWTPSLRSEISASTAGWPAEVAIAATQHVSDKEATFCRKVCGKNSFYPEPGTVQEVLGPEPWANTASMWTSFNSGETDRAACSLGASSQEALAEKSKSCPSGWPVRRKSRTMGITSQTHDCINSCSVAPATPKATTSASAVSAATSETMEVAEKPATVEKLRLKKSVRKQARQAEAAVVEERIHTKFVMSQTSQQWLEEVCRGVESPVGDKTSPKLTSRKSSHRQLTGASRKSESEVEIPKRRTSPKVASTGALGGQAAKPTKFPLSRSLQKQLEETTTPPATSRQAALEMMHEHAVSINDTEAARVTSSASTERSRNLTGVASQQTGDDTPKEEVGNKAVASKSKRQSTKQQSRLDIVADSHVLQQQFEDLVEFPLLPTAKKDIEKKAKRLQAVRLQVEGERQKGDATELAAQSSRLCNPSLKVCSGDLFQLQNVSHLSSEQLDSIFSEVVEVAKFRWFAGRSILDFKVPGTTRLELPRPYDTLDPLVSTMVALAENSLRDDEQLAILQLIVNYFKDGSNEVKPHRHRCRQICVSLGASRELNVDGRQFHMKHGDAVMLGGEEHSVPLANHICHPRVSVCLFYGSIEEYASQAISVNAVDGWFGDSFWWCHPQDFVKGKSSGKGKASKNRKPNDRALKNGRTVFDNGVSTVGTETAAIASTSIKSRTVVSTGSAMSINTRRTDRKSVV